MPKVDQELINVASYSLVGFLDYVNSKDRRKWDEIKKLTGITKGQWKRFQYVIKHSGKAADALRTSEASIKKLEVIIKHHDNPHFMTLLKMIDARGEK